MAFQNAYAGRRVLVTGDTGFKGTWLCEWLLALGADVHGYALPAAPQSLFNTSGIGQRITHGNADIRDSEQLDKAFARAKPDFVFHLAAQALVRTSYQDPVYTFDTNVMGVVRILEAARRRAQPCTVIVVTSDKCYANREWVHGYREEDALGGHDPYSASKGAAEIVAASYRSSFFPEGSPVAIVTARAGNVIGGGDWAVDRIVPDCVRALQSERTLLLRNPASTRPWQHVLEPLSGYLWLGARIDQALQSRDFTHTPLGAYNFGPGPASNRSVKELVEEVFKHWPGQWDRPDGEGAPHEAGLLSLSIDKALVTLGWRPVWDFGVCVAKTIGSYRSLLAGDRVHSHVLREQIEDYTHDAAKLGLSWAK